VEGKRQGWRRIWQGLVLGEKMEGGSVLGEHFVDVWEVHFEAVLVFVGSTGHFIEEPGFV
jgi:hypothetical protein